MKTFYDFNSFLITFYSLWLDLPPENQSVAAGELIGSCTFFVVFHPFVFCFRFMLQWPGVRILRRNELDAFLAQALSPKLYEPDQLQELKVIAWRLFYVKCPGKTQ